MGASVFETEQRTRTLSRALKLIRQRRGARAIDVAARLCLAPRSYEYFEAGDGQLNVRRVHRFARVLDADPLAILAAVEADSPELALRCLDNKLVTIAMMALAEFNKEAGDDIRFLDPQTLFSAFSRVFRDLAVTARQRAAIADGAPTPPPPPED